MVDETGDTNKGGDERVGPSPTSRKHKNVDEHPIKCLNLHGYPKTR